MPIDPYTRLRHRLSRNVLLTVVVVFIIGSLLPPYVPSSAQAGEVPLVSQRFQLAEEGFLMKTSPIISQRPRPTQYGQIITVQPGDNLSRLVEKYELNMQTLLWANGFKEGHILKPGDSVRIPKEDGVLHKVQANETLLGIANKYDVEGILITDSNQITDSIIRTNEFILIPGGEPLPEPVVAAATPNTPKPKPVAVQPTAPPAPIKAQPAQVAVKPTGGYIQNPCPGCVLTQGYRAGHYALDLADKGSTPIYAAKEGTVTRADFGWNGGYGNVIEVDHGGGLVTLYAHNRAFQVKEGDWVTRGQHIADMGNTGRVYGRTGIHLHFEVIQGGIKKNPFLYMD